MTIGGKTETEKQGLRIYSIHTLKNILNLLIPGAHIPIRDRQTWVIADLAAIFEVPILLSFSSKISIPSFNSLELDSIREMIWERKTTWISS